MTIILPIKPEYSSQIISKHKKYEYRTKIPKHKVDSILIYETHPTMRIVAKITIKNILCGSPYEIWSATKKYAGITKEQFDAYFSNSKKAFAYEIGEIERFSKPKLLSEYGINYIPQSFVYINDGTIRT